MTVPLACRVYGHRPRFWAEGSTLRWECERECTDGGTREYASGEDARRIAAALDVEDRDRFGSRAITSLMPLRMARRGR